MLPKHIPMSVDAHLGDLESLNGGGEGDQSMDSEFDIAYKDSFL